MRGDDAKKETQKTKLRRTLGSFWSKTRVTVKRSEHLPSSAHPPLSRQGWIGELKIHSVNATMTPGGNGGSIRTEWLLRFLQYQSDWRVTTVGLKECPRIGLGLINSIKLLYRARSIRMGNMADSRWYTALPTGRLARQCPSRCTAQCSAGYRTPAE